MAIRLPLNWRNRLAAIAPPAWTGVLTNSGSESVDTALKIAIAYHRARGAARRTRFIGREKGYHAWLRRDVGGRMVNNRKIFAASMCLGRSFAHTLDLGHNAFSRGLPHWAAHLANELNG